MNKIVIIGGDHHNTLGVLRSLGERGLQSDLILLTSATMTFVDASKYRSRLWKINNDDEILETLLIHYKGEVEKPVIICCSDSSSGVIDDNLDKLKPYFYLPGSGNQGKISELMSKKEMANLAEKVGIRTPRTIYLTSHDQDLSQIELPCIIKPIISRKGNKSEIAICRTLNELQKYANAHHICNNL